MGSPFVVAGVLVSEKQAQDEVEGQGLEKSVTHSLKREGQGAMATKSAMDATAHNRMAVAGVG
jgi:hypothetical protein